MVTFLVNQRNTYVVHLLKNLPLVRYQDIHSFFSIKQVLKFQEEKTPLDLAPLNLRRTLQKHSEQVQIIPTDR